MSQFLQSIKLSDTPESGFTLIELMVVVVVLSILAAIVVPSYRAYLTKNVRADAQSEMLQIQTEMDRWRASALSYKGFAPKLGVDNSGKAIYGYADAGNTFIYLPKGSTASNYRYKLTIVDGNASSLIPTTEGVDNSTGRSWKMLAEPNTSSVAKYADRILMTSTGLKCMGTASALTIDKDECVAGSQSW